MAMAQGPKADRVRLGPPGDLTVGEGKACLCWRLRKDRRMAALERETAALLAGLCAVSTFLEEKSGGEGSAERVGNVSAVERGGGPDLSLPGGGWSPSLACVILRSRWSIMGRF